MRSFGQFLRRPGAVVMVLAVAAIAIQFPFSLNHDAAWHFYTAFRALHGDRIGIDIADVNPPMTMWLLGAPAFVADVSGLPPASVLRSSVLLLQLAALGCTLGLLRRLGWGESAMSVAAASVGAALLLMPGYHFAQREHIAVALTLPYVLLAALRAEQKTVAVPIALAAGIAAAAGIGIKPHFLALPACLELWLCCRRRSLNILLRPETLALAVAGTFYLVAVKVFAPAYLDMVVPRALLAYRGFEEEGLELVTRIGAYLAACVCALGVALRRWGSDRLPAVVQAFVVAGLGFLIAALLQKKGWQYQVLPVALLWTSAAGLLFAAMDRRPRVVFALLAIASLQPLVPFLVDGLDRRGTTARVDALAHILSAPGRETVFAFVTSPRDIHPAVLQSRARWVDPFGALIFLPAQVRALSATGPDDLSRQVVALSEGYNESLLARLESDPPGVVMFDSGDRKLGIPDEANFDYLRFFARYDAFNRLMAEYSEVAPVGRFRIFMRSGAGS